MDGKIVLVTGASSGIGAALSRQLTEAGATVLAAARRQELLDQLGAAAAFRVDLSDPADALRLADEAVGRFGQVDVLVNNAGVRLDSPAIDASLEEIDQSFQVNVLSPMVLAGRLVPGMVERGEGVVANVLAPQVSPGRRGMGAYAASKAANVRIAETLAEEVAADGIDVNAIAPGAMNTRLMHDIVAAGPEAAGQAEWAAAVKLQKTGGTPPELAARLCVFLASEEGDGVTGRLLSAQWDPWERLAEFKDELARTDVYTLRRIVPKERGKEWE